MKPVAMFLLWASLSLIPSVYLLLTRDRRITGIWSVLHWCWMIFAFLMSLVGFHYFNMGGQL